MRSDQRQDHREWIVTRRELLRQLSLAPLAIPIAKAAALPLSVDRHEVDSGRDVQSSLQPAQLPPASTLSAEDDKFLNELEIASFRFFWEQANPKTGLIRDRCNVRFPKKSSSVASIASCGFGLTAICIAVKRGFIPYQQARLRVIQSLSFLWHKMPTHRGFYFHFADMNTGERVWDSELSSVDTSILLCGVLMCHAFFEDKDIQELAHAIFDRVDWTWISEDTALLSMGWTPELGFIPSRWGQYSELMMIYLLAMGSYSHPLPPDTWLAWKRTLFEYDGLRYIGSFAPLFVHQYSQAWFDFRKKRDQFADYYLNSAIATDAHRIFCLELSRHFPNYSDSLWGITASDSKEGYVIWGGPPAMGPIDGTIVPCAAGGSLPFLPAQTMRVLRNIYDHYPKARCRYGFVDAFNPLTGWYDTDVIGIDLGIIMLMAENARSGFVWETFMKNPEARRGMAAAGFTDYEPKEGYPSTA